MCTVEIDDKNQKRIGTFNYERYNFDFDSVYRDRNMFFIFDRSHDEFIGTDPRWHSFTNDNYLCYGHRFDAATFI